MLRLVSTLASGLIALGSLTSPTYAMPLFADGPVDRVREGPVAVAPGISDQQRPDADLHAATVGPAMRPLIPPRFNAMWPTNGQITTYFGEVGPYSPRGHSGLDIAGRWGTPVDAADDGEVLKAYWNDEGYGGLVIIGHPSGYETWYGHLARLEVEPGEPVKRGDEIGLMGSTGYSTGPHLHFELREDGQLMDPLVFLNEATLKDADW
jgi:murein DD-endopeptidase MepM/ murein hydrolase activator NlpD